MNKIKVGFIGLGAMGKPMAKHILKAGYPLVTMYHRNKASAEELVAAGATLVSNPAQVAAKADLIFICVPTAPDVEEILFGENGIVKADRKLTIVDCSTHDISSVRSFHRRLLDLNIQYLDAPISGGPKGAEAATLGMMVGGDQKTFESIKPVLQVVASNITYIGESGLGQAAKLANNLITSAQMVAISEAFTLAVKAGVKPRVLYEALKTATADSKILNIKVPNYLKDNYKPGFRLVLNHKDLGLIMKTGRDLNVPLFVTAVVDQLYGQAKQEFGELDSGSVALLYQKLTNTTFKDDEAE